MRDLRTLGSVRGAPSNGRPYRDPASTTQLSSAGTSRIRHFYLEHKGQLPAHIRNHRADIVEMLVAGLPVEQVFAMQIDGTPPEPPAARRR